MMRVEIMRTDRMTAFYKDNVMARLSTSAGPRASFGNEAVDGKTRLNRSQAGRGISRARALTCFCAFVVEVLRRIAEKCQRRFAETVRFPCKLIKL